MHDDTTRLGPSSSRRLRWFALIAVLALGLGACGDDDDDDAAPDDTDSGTETTEAGGDTGDTGGDAGAPVAYEVTSLSYSPVSAPAGGTLEIINSTGTPHTLTADDGSFEVEYGGGETATLEVPSSPGEYGFHCELHASMTATLTVE